MILLCLSENVYHYCVGAKGISSVKIAALVVLSDS